ncbi:Predicted Zn-dependent protease or its inactivated homolog [Hymenobacter daecheongensis DSM 21074]|uniref:Predicted Zn-dependent protease or its inactivated homolog n=1 Tax=Hymenobacter daecheongensis DSM 21074 TaxID=1121955 RepID=A0A1M6IU53_9BACT|nr:metallopeptidase TldD-related protein [Hymenobacter daecheongensis]SHJ37983.1 Predicted Zn-dependent protease or its inactivated homolog [Hymenobacter daecheongensis DSM 21074]
MAILSKDEAQNILKKVLSFSTADECEATLSGQTGGNVRSARNAISTSGAVDNVQLSVEARFGKRSGVATCNEFDDATLRRCVQRVEEIARLAPESPEYMPLLGPQQYLDGSKAFVQSTANITPDYRAQQTAASLNLCEKRKLTSAGFLNDTAGFTARRNSKGLEAYQPYTSLEYSVTVRTPDGTGSGYAVADYNDASKFDAGRLTQIAADKAAGSVAAKAIEPGKYTVILEPAASVELLSNMMESMDARAAGEGRSFLSKKGGGIKKGEKLFDERVSIYSDPSSADLPGRVFAGDGRPQKRVAWIEKGVVKNLYSSRFWAQKAGIPDLPAPGGWIMEGGTQSVQDMIKGTAKGILVTRLWYIRAVDPQTLLYTGLTRDGTFYIENGKIKHPVKNFRFNESPIIMLNNLEALGKPQRVDGNLVPPLKIREFTFTSLSDAV